MTIRSSIAALGAALLASACVVLPVKVESYDTACRSVTHHMELRTVQLAARSEAFYLCQAQDCLNALVAVGVTAASAVVSGSIVVIGNAVYWAEQRADCQTHL